MSTELLTRPDNNETPDDTPNDPNQEPVIVVLGAGWNTLHSWKALEGIQPYVADRININEAKVPVSPDRYFDTRTKRGKVRMARLLASCAVGSVLLSIPASAHASAITEHLEYVADGKINNVVVPKPAVRNIDELHEVNAKIREVEKRLREDDPDFDAEKNAFMHVHEHYTEKGSWRALREHFSEIVHDLGYLRSMTSTITEARTIESENRTVALEDGVFEDLSPHFISQALDIMERINDVSHLYIPNRSQVDIERFRYQGSELKENVETGFIARGSTTLTDKKTKTTHPIQFEWRGSKGATDHKGVVFEFEHPETHDVTYIKIDLQKNTLEVPDAVRHHFSTLQFEDNGYGEVIREGLTSDPGGSFQSWLQAQQVIKMMAKCKRRIEQTPLREHPTGIPIETLAA